MYYQNDNKELRPLDNLVAAISHATNGTWGSSGANDPKLHIDTSTLNGQHIEQLARKSWSTANTITLL
jgi:hypothetical protein